MPITDLLERNSKLYGEETCLVEINPEIQEEPRVTWREYELIQPTAGDDESNPRISWGKYAPDWRGRLMMPVTLMAHHGLVDGVHIARFYERLREQGAGSRE